MSIVSQLIAAFKKGAEGKDPNWPPPVEPTGGGGSTYPSTADDGHEFRQPPPGVGAKPAEELAVDGGDTAPIANLNTGTGPKAPTDPRPPVGGTQGPKDPEPPTDPSPGDGDGGTPPPPSAPFDPNQVIFRTAGGQGSRAEDINATPDEVKELPLADDSDGGDEAAATLNSGGVNPIVILRDRTLGGSAVEDPDAGGEVVGRMRQPVSNFRGEDLKVAEDPDAGSEVFSRLRPRPPVGQEIPAGPLGEQVTPIDDGGEAAGGKADLDDAFVRRLRFSPDSEPTLQSSDPEEGGEVFSEVKFKIEPAYLKFGEYKAEPEYKPEGDIKPEGPIKFEGGKVEHDWKVDGGATLIASSDPEEGGEVTREVQPGAGRGYIGETEKDLKSFSSDPEEGGEVSAGEEFFKVKMEDIVVTPPAAPGGVPVPYPLSDDPPDDDGDGADWIARRPGKVGAEFLASSSSSGEVMLGDSDEPPGDDGDGAADWIARKAGKGQEEFLKVKMEDILVTSVREGGESPGEEEPPDDEGSGVAAWLARGKGYPKGGHTSISDDPPAAADVSGGEDDELESSTLVRLRPQPAAKEMLPGLGGEVPDDLDLDLDADADGDTDESEL